MSKPKLVIPFGSHGVVGSTPSPAISVFQSASKDFRPAPGKTPVPGARVGLPTPKEQQSILRHLKARGLLTDPAPPSLFEGPVRPNPDRIPLPTTPAQEQVSKALCDRVGFDIHGDLTPEQKIHLNRASKQLRDAHGTSQDLKGRIAAMRDLKTFMGASHGDRAECVRKFFAAHYQRFYPKNIVCPDGYYDPKHLTGTFTISDIMRMERIDPSQPEDTAKEQVKGIAIAGHLWARIKCPTFFLSKGLAEALDATDLPRDYAPPPMKWPLPAFAVMLARDMLKFQGLDVASILYSRRTISESVRIPSPVFDQNGPFDRMFREVWEIKDLIIEPGDPVPDLQTVTFVLENGDAMSQEFVDGEPYGGKPVYVMGGTVEASQSLNDGALDLLLHALKLLMVLQHSPDLVGRESAVVHEPGRQRYRSFDPAAKWSPNFLGRTYRMRGAGEGHSGDGKRPHLRRGHARRQRYGPGRTLVEERWIEPVIVNASKWRPGDPVAVLSEIVS